ncbi:MAG: hypothetical protein ACTHXA_02025 [Gulosibacter sp.]|uniref:hypothetical protein n=1 Tax=Gulosibacter sp. TaxID=2817531 RepID=UPI003F9148D0
MGNLNRVRKGLTLGAILPLSLFGLAACAAGGEDIDTERTRAPRAEAPEDGGSGVTGDGDAPFEFPGQNPPEDDAPEDDAESEAPQDDASDSGSSGNDDTVVKFGDVDYSSVNFDVSCDPDPEFGYILGREEGNTSSTAHAFQATYDNDGVVDYMMVTDGTYEDGTSLYWSDYSGEGGSVEMTISGDKFTISGDAFDYNDYQYDTVIPFEISGTCDTVFDVD